MKRIRFTEEQIIGVLREAEAGAKTADLVRKHGVSEATLYNWKAKYGGLEVSEAKRLQALEDENGRLKRLLADAMLYNADLKDLLLKNGNACRQAGNSRASCSPAWCQRAAGVQGHCGRSHDCPLLDLYRLICPLLGGPKSMLFWTRKGKTNAIQETHAGRDCSPSAPMAQI